MSVIPIKYVYTKLACDLIQRTIDYCLHFATVVVFHYQFFFSKTNRKQMSEAGIAYPSGAPDFLCCALIFD
jgi:hypothetical protein